MLVVGLSVPTIAMAEAGQSVALEPLLSCRSVTETTARLACFDTQAAALYAATQNKQITVVDAAEMKKVRRSLFGFQLPRLNLLARDTAGNDPEKDIDEIQSTIKSAFQRGDGRWVVVLDDDARWVQNDSTTLRFDAKAGDPIRIRKAAMGSYLARINNQTAIRMMRENR
ncbi:hypothetical protein [Sphingomonas sp.]|uniref:hypothetical protein n=1 Tax=Sphingomonas sp. TaxID=28214 RepID=UPI003B3A2725